MAFDHVESMRKTGWRFAARDADRHVTAMFGVDVDVGHVIKSLEARVVHALRAGRGCFDHIAVRRETLGR